MLRPLLCSMFMLVNCQLCFSTTVFSDENGNWNSAATWNPGIPGCYDTIVISAGTTVTLTSIVDLTACPPVTIIIRGTLQFQTGKKLDLPCDSQVIIEPGGSLLPGGGGGSSNWITICGDAVWTAADGPLFGGTTLAIELVSFTATLIDRHTEILWITASETNNDYFTVQRSATGIDWETIEIVDAGAGTSSIEQVYHVVDDTPYLGLNYYRLRQTDFDGTISTFDPVVINNQGIQFGDELIVFPNPSGGEMITIFLADYDEPDVEIQLYSVTGQRILKTSLIVSDGGLAVLKLDGNHAAGPYFLRANAQIERIVYQ